MASDDGKVWLAGSSPRVRGTRLRSLGGGRVRGFIPARAGNALIYTSPDPTNTVHPRACGERLIVVGGNVAFVGSSPRVRGTRRQQNQPNCHHRFIPARAGNAYVRAAQRSSATVHPRACGERSDATCTRFNTSGSSPRVRGTHTTALRPKHPLRFIPARAGNAGGSWRRSSPTTVHPRACGERSLSPRKRRIRRGSSPRVRGTPLARGYLDTPNRFIPARAGNATRSWLFGHPESVHPRACGERQPLL